MPGEKAANVVIYIFVSEIKWHETIRSTSLIIANIEDVLDVQSHATALVWRDLS